MSPTPELESRMGFSRLNWVFHGAAGVTRGQVPPRPPLMLGSAIPSPWVLCSTSGVGFSCRPSLGGGGERDEDGEEPAEQETI